MTIHCICDLRKHAGNPIEKEVPPARFERTTPGLGILCSILLSYEGMKCRSRAILSERRAIRQALGRAFGRAKQKTVCSRFSIVPRRGGNKILHSLDYKRLYQQSVKLRRSLVKWRSVVGTAVIHDRGFGSNYA